MSRSAAASTYTWQLPVKCLMTGILASAATRRIRPSPPRGIARSMYCGMRQKLADRRAVGRAHQLHGVGRQARLRRPPRASRSTIAWLECIASLPPRRITALPLFTQIAAASAVTFGRDS